MLLDPIGWGLTQRGDEVLSQAGANLAGHCAAETHEAALELRTAPHATVRDAIDELRELRSLLSARPDATRHGGRGVRDPSRADGRADQGVAVEPLPGDPPDHARPRPARADVRAARARGRTGPAARDPAREPVPRPPAAAARAVGLLAAVCAGARTAWPRTVRSCSRASRARGSRADSTSYRDWVATVDLLVRSGAIPEPTFLWWDVRPQPRLGTVEVRIMDAQPRLASTAALVALVQALARLELEQGYRLAEARRRAGGAGREPLHRRAGRDDGRADRPRARNARSRCRSYSTKSSRPPARTRSRSMPSTELDAVRMLVLAPEPRRQESLAASAGVPGLVADLAARFSA